jgi:hypothetical protein
MSGFPFSKESNSNYAPVAATQLDNAASAIDQPIGLMLDATDVTIVSGTGANNSSALDSSIRGAGFRVRISITYHV